MEKTRQPAIDAASAPAPRFADITRLRAALVALARAHWAAATLGGIVILATVVRVHDIVGNPPGFFADEASYGYNAYTILHTAKDEHGARLPLFFQAFGEYKLGVFIYSQVPLIALLGLSELSVRLTSALYGVLTVVGVYLLVRALFQRPGLALLAAGTLAILPWHIFYSRTGLGEVAAYPFFLVFATFIFLLAVSRPRLRPVAALVFAIALFSYRAAWILVPPLVVVLAVLYFRELARGWPWTLASALVLAGAVAIIVTHLTLVSTDRAQQESILALDLSTQETVERFFRQYATHFESSFLFDGAAEGNLRHVLPGYGWLYRWQIPFLALGAAALLWRPTRPKLLVLAMLALFPLTTAVTQGSPSSSRAFFGAVPFSIITAYGIATAAALLGGGHVPARLRPAGRLLAGGVLAAVGVVAGLGLASFLDVYHGEYQQVSAGYWGWQWGAGPIVEHFAAVEDEYDELVMEGAFNAAEVFLPFYAPDACAKCTFGHWDRYDPAKRQLFALQPFTLAPAFNFDIKGWLYAPSGELAFVFAEIEGDRATLPGHLPNVSMEYAGATISQLDAVLASDPQRASAYVDRGSAHWAEGKFWEAVGDYGTAISIDANLALAYYNRGNVYAAVGVFDYAINDYRKAIELQPDLAAAHNNAGNVYLQIKAYDPARKDLDQAIALDPELAIAHANRGFAYLGLGQGSFAVADFDRAIQLEPGLALAHAGRATVLLAQGDPSRALASLDQAVRLEPGRASFHLDRAVARYRLADYGAAADDADGAVALDHDHALAYAWRGLSKLRLGDAAGALPDLETAVALDRGFTASPGGRANSHWSLGDTTGLAGDLQAAAPASGDGQTAARLRDVIDDLSMPDRIEG